MDGVKVGSVGKYGYLLALLVFVLGIGLGYLLRMYYPRVMSEPEGQPKQVKAIVSVSPSPVPTEQPVVVSPTEVMGPSAAPSGSVSVMPIPSVVPEVSAIPQ